MEAIKIAEEREMTVMAAFNKYDADGSGTIDMSELLSLLEDLGLLNKLKTDRKKFAAEMFEKHDANDDNVLDFEEVRARGASVRAARGGLPPSRGTLPHPIASRML